MNMTGSSAPTLAKGLMFAWIPIVLILGTMFYNVFRALSPNKAMGLGAIAGGISEGLVVFGVVALIASECYGSYLLVRLLPNEQSFLKVVAIVSVVASMTFAFAFIAGVVWIFSRVSPPR